MAALVLLLVNATTAPPAGAAALSVTVPVPFAPPVSVAGFSVSEASADTVSLQCLGLSLCPPARCCCCSRRGSRCHRGCWRWCRSFEAANADELALRAKGAEQEVSCYWIYARPTLRDRVAEEHPVRSQGSDRRLHPRGQLRPCPIHIARLARC